MLDRPIDLQNLDPGTLTPELWGAIKRDAVRRAHEERKQAVAQFLGMLTFWRRPAGQPGRLNMRFLRA